MICEIKPLAVWRPGPSPEGVPCSLAYLSCKNGEARSARGGAGCRAGSRWVLGSTAHAQMSRGEEQE